MEGDGDEKSRINRLAINDRFSGYAGTADDDLDKQTYHAVERSSCALKSLSRHSLVPVESAKFAGKYVGSHQMASLNGFADYRTEFPWYRRRSTQHFLTGKYEWNTCCEYPGNICRNYETA